jgi:cytidylate kinase
MMIWLNGPFGVGKTATAREIAARRPNLSLFDPETVGHMLMANLRGLSVADFQDLPAWRALVPKVASAVATEHGSDLVAFQTVLVASCWAELRRGLDEARLPVFHVLLDASDAVLRQRIAVDDVERAAQGWRLDHVAAYVEAKPWLSSAADCVIDTSALNVEAVADRVLEAAGR